MFLRVICGWPKSLFDWDVLFLLPLPWWGPVLAPVCIALLMIAWGTLVSQRGRQDPPTALTSTAWRLNWLGVALALYVFMADSLRACRRPGRDEDRCCRRPSTGRCSSSRLRSWPLRREPGPQCG